jgi:hypothetical protein
LTNSNGYLDGSFEIPRTYAAPFDPPGTSTNGITLSAINQIRYEGFYLPYQTTVTTIMYYVKTADSNNYDLGIYDHNGNLKCHTGATSLSGTGFKSTAVLVNATLAIGQYYFAVASNGTTFSAILAAGGGGGTPTTFATVQTSGTAASGAVLPSTISVAADTWTSGTVGYFGLR